jgi:hypothetical protein
MAGGNGKARSPRLSNGKSPATGGKTTSTEPQTADRFATGHDVVLINGEINERLLIELVSQVSAQITANPRERNKRIVLAVVTYGGLPNSAYRIGRYLQTMYDEVACFVPSVCKSAGTLIITAGHQLVLSPFGELGPLDVQVRQRDELWGRRSGLTTRAALSDLKTHTFETFEHLMLRMIERSGGSISTRLAAEVAARLSADLMAKIYEQVNPESLGQDVRDLSIATEYCKRLNRRSQNLKPDAIDRLVHRYPSHDFVIDLEEAREVFQRVSPPTASLYRFMSDHDMLTPRMGDGVVKFLTESRPIDESRKSDGSQELESGHDATNGATDEKGDAGRTPPSS